MAHEHAKLLLEQAKNFGQRAEAVRQAMGMGMPLSEIEQYLDWLDQRKLHSIRFDEEQSDDSSAEDA
ncbi:MAG: hypothetical protein JXB10_13505 [Pirellulales bacterium]|nr:hypothetical protein [Pirellulales bacterium]